MNDISPELKKLFLDYNGDTKAILKDHPDLRYLHALSDIRENVLEWYEFNPEASLLEIGSGYGALTGLYSRRVKKVTVLEPEPENISLNKLRHEKRDNIRYVSGSLLGNLSGLGGETFDYITMIGSVEETYKEQIEKAKTLLKPGGTLILAACSRMGLKYQAGAKPEAVALSKAELVEALCGGEHGSGKAEFYYPMPDYRLPVTIYSDAYPPAKGELTHAILAYDYPDYLRFDLGKRYDEACEAKQFETVANSFLAIWSSHEEN